MHGSKRTQGPPGCIMHKMPVWKRTSWEAWQIEIYDQILEAVFFLISISRVLSWDLAKSQRRDMSRFRVILTFGKRLDDITTKSPAKCSSDMMIYVQSSGFGVLQDTAIRRGIGYWNGSIVFTGGHLFRVTFGYKYKCHVGLTWDRGPFQQHNLYNNRTIPCNVLNVVQEDIVQMTVKMCYGSTLYWCEIYVEVCINAIRLLST